MTFSNDGERIFAINTQNELCILDPRSLQTLSKRQIPEFDHYNKICAAHIFQIDHNKIAIGAFYGLPSEHECDCGLNHEDEEDYYEELHSIVFIISGDFLAPDSQLRTYSYQMDTLRGMNLEFLPSWKFKYCNDLYIFLA